MSHKRHPALVAAVEAGDIHPFDVEWIERVPYDRQPATVEKAKRWPSNRLTPGPVNANQGRSQIAAYGGPTYYG